MPALRVARKDRPTDASTRLTSQGAELVVFAEEATDREYLGTVHGAF